MTWRCPKCGRIVEDRPVFRPAGGAYCSCRGLPLVRMEPTDDPARDEYCKRLVKQGRWAEAMLYRGKP